ncbi:MAG: tetratricopeptide repeat protein [Stagnimonas sp.]|nr:tetratricopeptide repeat protein [Stagnimonas sp.]
MTPSAAFVRWSPPVLEPRSAPLHAALFCAAGFAGLALAPMPVLARVEKEAQVASPLSPQAQAQFHVLAGEMAAGRHLPEAAAEEFLKALKFAADPALAARATAFALAAKRDDLALQASQQWLVVEPSSMDAREVIALMSLKGGNVAEAKIQCEAIVKGHPGGEGDGYRHVALLLSQEKSTAQPALALMKTLAAEKPQSAAAQRALALLAFRFDDIATTEKAAREALRIAPMERESTLLLVAALVKRGDLAAADQAINPLLEGKNTTDLRLGYAKLLIDANQRVAAKEQINVVLKADPKSADAHMAMGLLLLDERQPDQAEPHFTALIENPDRKGDAAYYLGRIAEIRKQPGTALAWYEKVTSGTQVLDSFIRRARVLALLKRMPEARQLLGALREQYPPLNSRLLATEGELLTQDNALIEALSLYDVALKEQPDDAELLYARSLLHERMNRFELAEADLRALITANADDARALNALGYMLTMHTTRFDEAGKLIAKAYELEPSDPAILDSLGWVRFKQGKPAEALPLLQKAHDIFPDAEVAAHLGEVLWALGEKDKARNLLEAASREDSSNRVLRDTVQRLLTTP